ncbi:MAG: hypothetical protein IKQ62_09950 [Bacteroidaceae bacterium]|nr:hypothetical protein [Bacteroidaceae bacterium]
MNYSNMTTHNTHSPQSPLNNEDIIAAARQLRQEQNDRMHIRPWKRQSRWGWYVSMLNDGIRYDLLAANIRR